MKCYHSLPLSLTVDRHASGLFSFIQIWLFFGWSNYNLFRGSCHTWRKQKASKCGSKLLFRYEPRYMRSLIQQTERYLCHQSQSVCIFRSHINREGKKFHYVFLIKSNFRIFMLFYYSNPNAIFFVILSKNF